MMFLATLLPVAEARDWAGEWGIDPSRSDEPSSVISGAYTGPELTGGPGASRFSPDGGAIDHEAERAKILYEALDMLGVSGRLSLSHAAEGSISVGWGDGTVLVLPSSRRWTKVGEGPDRYRIRALDLGEQLFVERRAKLAAVSETLIPQDGDDLVCVVRIDGATLQTGVEFRRVYRKLEDRDAQPASP